MTWIVLKFKNLSLIFQIFRQNLGLEQLKTFNELLLKQNRNAEKIKVSLDGVLPSNISPAYFLCCVSVEDRNTFSKHMFESGVFVGYAHYPVLSDMVIFEKYKCDCPNARIAKEKLVYFPCKTHLRDRDIKKITDTLLNCNTKIKGKSHKYAYASSITNIKP